MNWCEVFLVTRRTVLEGVVGQTVSLFPFAGDVTGVTLTGFEYPLTKATLALDGRRHRIRRGCLVAVRYFRPGEFPGEVGR